MLLFTDMMDFFHHDKHDGHCGWAGIGRRYVLLQQMILLEGLAADKGLLSLPWYGASRDCWLKAMLLNRKGRP